MSLFIDMDKAAKEAGITIRQFRRLIADNPPKSFIVSRKRFFLKADFMKWLQTHKAKV